MWWMPPGRHGMTELQVLFRAEFPNGLPVMYGRVPDRVLQAIATVSVVAYINLGGLGRYLFDDLVLSDFPQCWRVPADRGPDRRRPCPCPHSEAVPVTGEPRPSANRSQQAAVDLTDPVPRGLLFKEVRHEGIPPTSPRQARIRRRGCRRRPGHGPVRLRRLIQSAELHPGHQRCRLVPAAPW